MRKLVLHITLILFLFSCEEKIDWDTEPKSIIRLVVDGMITNQEKAHGVKLSLPVLDLNQTALPVSDALVAITDQENIFILEEDPEKPGMYYTEPNVQGVLGKVYTLYIRVGENEFTGSSYMVPVEPLPPLNIVTCDETENYFYIETVQTGDPFMMEIYYNWSDDEDCEINSCDALSIDYFLNTIDVNEIFKPEKQKVCFPSETHIYRTKYSLNEDYRQFLRSVMIESEWRGGLFDVERGNITTNLSEGAIGYFAASTVITDTTYFSTN